MEQVAATAIGTKVVEVALTETIKTLMREIKPIKPLKEKIGVILAITIQINEVPETEVSEVLEKFIHDMPQSFGKLPNEVLVLKANGCELATQFLTYGSLDEMWEDDFEKQAEFSMSPYGEQEGIPEIVPTVNSMTVFLYPISLDKLTDIIICYQSMERIRDDLCRSLNNNGSKRFLILYTERKNIIRLNKATQKVAKRYSVEISQFENQYGLIGLKVVDPGELAVKEMLDDIQREFAGVIGRIIRR
jgi:hypothetical protein